VISGKTGEDPVAREFWVKAEIYPI